MITFTRIGYMGRLGNQMFQFASTLGISKKLNLEAKFPINNCISPHASGPIDSVTGRNMDVKCNLLECFDIGEAYFIPNNHIELRYYYNEADFSFDPNVYNISDGCDLIGYYQTELYFNDIKDLIFEQFKFKKKYQEIAEKYIAKIRDSNKEYHITSIHVRRGDYLTSSDYHPPCSNEYYNDSVKKIEDSGKNKFVIFSDDPDWCAKTFTDDKYIISNLADPYIELCAMTLCDNNIIANSSFSWWGAWLNRKNDKIVISPSRWFGPLLDKNASDVYCKNWQIV
jgi:hypothetical protein